MQPYTIYLAKDFSAYPGGRYRTDGPYSGELFRETVLLPALNKYEIVAVDIDGVAGLPVSFTEEAFGGLVRTGVDPKELQRRLMIVTRTARLSRYPGQIRRYIEEAKPLARAG